MKLNEFIEMLGVETHILITESVRNSEPQYELTDDGEFVLVPEGGDRNDEKLYAFATNGPSIPVGMIFDIGRFQQDFEDKKVSGNTNLKTFTGKERQFWASHLHNGQFLKRTVNITGGRQNTITSPLVNIITQQLEDYAEIDPNMALVDTDWEGMYTALSTSLASPEMHKAIMTQEEHAGVIIPLSSKLAYEDKADGVYYQTDYTVADYLANNIINGLSTIWNIKNVKDEWRGKGGMAQYLADRGVSKRAWNQRSERYLDTEQSFKEPETTELDTAMAGLLPPELTEYYADMISRLKEFFDDEEIARQVHAKHDQDVANGTYGSSV